MRANIGEATKEAERLKADGRLDDAIALHRDIVTAHPESRVALHNLASALGDAGYWTEAEPIIRAALAGGLDAPESWLVLARSSQALGRLDEADRCYQDSLRRRPTLEAHRELVQLRWMRGDGIAHAARDLDAAIAAAPQTPALRILKAQVLMEAGANDEALALLSPAAATWPDDASVATIMAQAALAAARGTQAIEHAKRAVRLAPDLPAAHVVLIESLLSAARFAEASQSAADFLRRAPLDQHAIALQAVAWRALGDARYGELFDYDTLLCVTQLSTPPGWPNLSAYLADLHAALTQAHHFQTHPFAQSIRQGSQASNILQLPHPAARALRAALDEPIRAYIDTLGAGADRMRARNTGSYKFQGMWSILMRAGGRHINHVHPEGWISSACYVDVPARNQSQEGWIKFGEPNVECGLAAERCVEPIPGRLVLFPSYMWHGTIPFTENAARLTFAFDAVSA